MFNFWTEQNSSLFVEVESMNWGLQGVSASASHPPSDSYQPRSNGYNHWHALIGRLAWLRGQHHPMTGPGSGCGDKISQWEFRLLGGWTLLTNRRVFLMPTGRRPPIGAYGWVSAEIWLRAGPRLQSGNAFLYTGRPRSYRKSTL